jgi:lysozyme
MGIKTRLFLAAITVATPVVAHFEGRNLLAHLDPVGIPTICEGWTRGVQLGDKATPEQCDAYTRQGLDESAEVFKRWVPEHVVNGLSPKTLAAFLSFIYNVGPGAKGMKDGFVWLKDGRHSTMLLHLRAGRVAEACAEFRYPQWTSAGGRQLRGLVRRRAAERQLCEAEL